MNILGQVDAFVNTDPSKYYQNYQDSRGTTFRVLSGVRENEVHVKLDVGVDLGRTTANIDDNAFQAEAVINDAVSAIPDGIQLVSVQSFSGGAQSAAHTFRNEVKILLKSDPLYTGAPFGVLNPALGEINLVHDLTKLGLDDVAPATGVHAAIRGTSVESNAVGNRVTVTGGAESSENPLTDDPVIYTYQLAEQEANTKTLIHAVTGELVGGSPLMTEAERLLHTQGRFAQTNILGLEVQGRFVDSNFETTDNVFRATAISNSVTNGYTTQIRASDPAVPGWQSRQHNTAIHVVAETRGNVVYFGNQARSIGLSASLPSTANLFGLGLTNSRVTLANNRFEALSIGNLMRSGPTGFRQE